MMADLNVNADCLEGQESLPLPISPAEEAEVTGTFKPQRFKNGTIPADLRHFYLMKKYPERYGIHPAIVAGLPDVDPEVIVIQKQRTLKDSVIAFKVGNDIFIPCSTPACKGNAMAFTNCNFYFHPRPDGGAEDDGLDITKKAIPSRGNIKEVTSRKRSMFLSSPTPTKYKMIRSKGIASPSSYGIGDGNLFHHTLTGEVGLLPQGQFLYPDLETAAASGTFEALEAIGHRVGFIDTQQKFRVIGPPCILLEYVDNAEASLATAEFSVQNSCYYLVTEENMM